MLQEKTIYRHMNGTHPIDYGVNHGLRGCYRWRVICNPMKHGGGKHEIVALLAFV
jgi:hypothetical protein